MVRDYSGLPYTRERKKTRSEASAAGRAADGKHWLRSVIGWVFATAALLGVVGSLWLNWSINQGLAALSRERAASERLKDVNRHLREKRDALREQKRIENAAAKLGLQPPNAKQIRRP